jgi:hypothetical protein
MWLEAIAGSDKWKGPRLCFPLCKGLRGFSFAIKEIKSNGKGKSPVAP